jgi:hypothetical protein
VLARGQSSNSIEWTVGYTGLSLITPSGYPSADVYLEMSHESATQGPTPLAEVRAKGMTLAVSGGSVTLEDVGSEKFRITAAPWSVGVEVRLFVRDPAARVANISLA